MPQRLHKLQQPNHQFQTIYLQGHFRVFLASPIPRFRFLWKMNITAKSSFCIENLHILRSLYQLKSKIPASCGGVYYGDRKIKCLKALDWQATDVTLRSKIINVNNFKTDIIADAVEDYWIDFEDIRYGKGETSKPK